MKRSNHVKYRKKVQKLIKYQEKKWCKGGEVDVQSVPTEMVQQVGKKMETHPHLPAFSSTKRGSLLDSIQQSGISSFAKFSSFTLLLENTLSSKNAGGLVALFELVQVEGQLLLWNLKCVWC